LKFKALKQTMARKANKDVKASELDAGAIELASQLSRVINAAKRRAPSPPQAMLDAACREENLGPRHAPVLFAVAMAEGMSVSEIADHIGLSVATASLMVGELSRSGILVRTEDERDRRRTLVTVSPELAGPMKAWRDEVLGPIRNSLERLTPEERATLSKALAILVEENERGE
jgi:DNA-binding MarR family transcriptional regulator